MIVAERKPKVAITKMDRFGEQMPDGRLTASSDGRTFCLSEELFFLKD